MRAKKLKCLMFEFLRVTGELEEPHNKGVTHIKPTYSLLRMDDNMGQHWLIFCMTGISKPPMVPLM